MFYTLIKIITVSFYILSCSSYGPKKKRFPDYLAFREALYAGILAHTRPTADIVNTDAKRSHQRVSLKRASYIICKQAATEERKEIKGIRR